MNYYSLQVSQLLVLADSRGDALYLNLMSSALVVMEAVENMANVAQKIATESADEVRVIRPRKSGKKMGENPAFTVFYSPCSNCSWTCRLPMSRP